MGFHINPPIYEKTLIHIEGYKSEMGIGVSAQCETPELIHSEH